MDLRFFIYQQQEREKEILSESQKETEQDNTSIKPEVLVAAYFTLF
jgi:hypothetical protein